MEYRGEMIGRRGMLAVAGSLVAWDSSATLGPTTATPPQGVPGLAQFTDYLRSPSGGQMVGWRPAADGAALRTVHDKMSDDSVSVKDFGALGDGAMNDYASILLARSVALATGRALLFPEGEYLHSDTLEFGFSHLRVFFRGRVTLRHTGAGKAISFDAGPTPNIDGKNEINFGWDCPPTLIGNKATTDLVYVRGCHHMKMDIRLRDCTTGLRVDFSVLSHFRINGSINEGGFPHQQPTNWLIVDKRDVPEATTACKFDVIAEGSTGFGLKLIAAQSCQFWGTSEGNEAGGVEISSDSIKNNFYEFFCEQNGSDCHWDIAGSYNNFFNCSGGGPANTGDNNTKVTGIRNQFFGGNFHNVTEIGYYNEWRQTALTGTYNHNVDSVRALCHDGAGKSIPDTYPKPTITAPSFVGSWINAGSTFRNVGWWKDSYGYVHIAGAAKRGAGVIFVLPAGSRPGGDIWKKVYNPTADVDVVIVITTDGNVQQISGDTGAVPLDGISFLAEG